MTEQQRSDLVEALRCALKEAMPNAAPSVWTQIAQRTVAIMDAERINQDRKLEEALARQPVRPPYDPSASGRCVTILRVMGGSGSARCRLQDRHAGVCES